MVEWHAVYHVEFSLFMRKDAYFYCMRFLEPILGFICYAMILPKVAISFDHDGLKHGVLICFQCN